MVALPESGVKSLPEVAVPFTLYSMTVGVELAAVCVMVKTPETGPDSSPPVVASMRCA